MNLLEALDKLINERGSSAILRDHVALFRDQVIELEKQNTTLTTQNSDLRAENCALKKQVIGITEQVDNLNTQKAKLDKDNNELRKNIQKLKQTNEYTMKYGCIMFHDDERLYCPKCYFDKSKKIPTTRKNIQLRYCSVCQADIPAG